MTRLIYNTFVNEGQHVPMYIYFQFHITIKIILRLGLNELKVGLNKTAVLLQIISRENVIVD